MTGSPRLLSALTVVLIAAALGGGRAAAAQGFTAHLFAGAAGTTFVSEAGTEFTPAVTFTGGFGGGYTFGFTTSLNAELVYVVRAAETELPIGTVPSRVRFQYTDVEVPLYVAFRGPELGRVTPIVLGGASFAFNRDARLRYRALSGGPTFDEVDGAAAGRVAHLVAGLGAEAPFGTDRAFVQVRLHLAQDDLREQASRFRSRAVFVVLGVAF